MFEKLQLKIVLHSNCVFHFKIAFISYKSNITRNHERTLKRAPKTLSVCCADKNGDDHYTSHRKGLLFYFLFFVAQEFLVENDFLDVLHDFPENSFFATRKHYFLLEFYEFTNI